VGVLLVFRILAIKGKAISTRGVHNSKIADSSRAPTQAKGVLVLGKKRVSMAKVLGHTSQVILKEIMAMEMVMGL
jgi:hypothetical protein